MDAADGVLEGGRHPITFLRHCFAQDELRSDAPGIVHDFGYAEGRELTNHELLVMTTSPDVSDLSSSVLREFRRMDLALEVSDDRGEIRYIAVEIGFRAEQRAIDRALFHACLLTRFTGQPADAAIAVGRDFPELSEEAQTGKYPVSLDTAGGQKVYLLRMIERNMERSLADLRYEKTHCGF